MATTLMRRVLDALMPHGAIWRPKLNGYMDGLHNGMAANMQVVHDFIAQLANIRNPASTPILSDLETEYGISSSDGLNEAQRRLILRSRMYSRGNKGQYWVLQNAINLAGFTGVNVIPNDPPVNPVTFISGTSQMCCRGSNAYAGYYTGASAPPYSAFAAVYGGLLIVNGSQYANVPTIVGCGSGLVSCHPIYPNQVNSNLCGSFMYFSPSALTWGPPLEPHKWPLIFFIGGTATYDGTGHIIALTQCSIPASRMAEFISLVLHFKPIHSWAALIYSN